LQQPVVNAFEFLVRQVTHQRDSPADQIHVFLHGLVVIETKAFDDFLVILLDGLLFALHRTEDYVFATRGRVARTAGDEHARGRDEKWE